MCNDSNKLLKEIIVAVITALVTVCATKTCDRISPEENRVIISDTLRVVEAHTTPQVSSDSLLYSALLELTRTLQETSSRDKNIKVVLSESGVSKEQRKQVNRIESVSASTPIVNNISGAPAEQVIILESHSYVNKVIDKNGFYKKGYTISDGASYYVLEKRPRANDEYLTFEVRLIQSADLLSHIYMNICSVNEKGELYQYFGQAYEVRNGLNRIKIANNLHEGKNRIEIGVFKKSDEGKDFPTFYRNVFSLEK